jgi:hypothetical protein
MNADYIGLILTAIAIGLTWISQRNRELLLCIGASVAWAGLTAFIIQETVAGQNWQVITLVALVVFSVSLLLTGVFSKEGVNLGDGIKNRIRRAVTPEDERDIRRSNRRERINEYEERTGRAINGR